MSAKRRIRSSDSDDISLLWLLRLSGFSILFTRVSRRDWVRPGFRDGHFGRALPASSSLPQAARSSLGRKRAWRQLSWERSFFSSSYCFTFLASPPNCTIRAPGPADLRFWRCAEALWSCPTLCQEKNGSEDPPLHGAGFPTGSG